MTEAKEVIIYTDGACSGNPGPGGYAAILRHKNHEKVVTGGYRNTTNNRMELLAAIKALETLKEPCKVTLYSDSKYLVDAMTLGWARRWQANNWMRNKRDRALNPDLWERLLELTRKHNVSFIWTRGHNNDEYNERCDKLAVEASRQPGLPPDIRK